VADVSAEVPATDEPDGARSRPDAVPTLTDGRFVLSLSPGEC